MKNRQYDVYLSAFTAWSESLNRAVDALLAKDNERGEIHQITEALYKQMVSAFSDYLLNKNIEENLL